MRRKKSISNILVTILGGLIILKAFVWVVDSRVLHVPIEIPFLNYGIIIAFILLLLRVSFVLIKTRAMKLNHDIKKVDNDFSVPGDTFHCADCGNRVSEKVRNYCLERPSKFNNQVFCYEHQR